MTSKGRAVLLTAGCVFVGVLVTEPALAQQEREAPEGVAAGDGDVIYEREVFDYDRAGRRDPFRSLLEAAELAVRVEDLTVVGVVHDRAGRSVVVLRERGTDRRFRVREGDRIGGIRVSAIHPDRVELLVEEFGVVRRETLQIRRRDR